MIGKLGPRLEPRVVGGRMTGLTAQQRLNQAEAVLRGMSLTKDFARLVLLAGHTGEASARIAADILNDPAVRAAAWQPGVGSSIWPLHDVSDEQSRNLTRSRAAPRAAVQSSAR